METKAKLPYWAGLDGLRGLAVVAVLLFHGGVSWAEGGFLGVSLFFTLSGFLITSIIVREREATGGVSLGGFWARRARRLLPASILALLMAIVATRVGLPTTQRLEALGDIRAAAFNLANWRFIWNGAVYADVTRVASPVQHYWSLAIEEQFYLVFPLLAMLALRRRKAGLAAVLGLVVVLSTWRQLALDDTNRIYFGTDTRAAELAIGGLLALSRERITALLTGRLRHLVDIGGLVALVTTVVLWSEVADTNPALYVGGFSAIAVVSAALIFAGVEGRIVPRILSLPGLPWLGVISYGVYLYHFPIYLVFSEANTGLDGWPLLGLQIALTLVAAVISFYLIERPVRHGARLRGQRSTVAFVGCLAIVMVTAFGYTSRLHGRGLTDDMASGDVVVTVGEPPTTTTTEAPDPTSSTDGTTSTTATTVGEVVPVTDGPTTTAAPQPTTTSTTLPPPAAPHVLVVGDSTAAGIGRGLHTWGQESGRLQVTSVTSSGCAAYSGKLMRVRQGYEFSPKGCDTLFTTAADTARSQNVDAIVVFIGSSQLADWTYQGQDGWHSILEGPVTSAYTSALAGVLDKLTSVGVPVLWADLPTPNWDLETFGEITGGPLPGSGPVTLNDAARAEVVNRTTSRAIAGRPLAVVWPWTANLAGGGGDIPRSVRPDGLHVDEDKVGDFADSWLFPLLDSSYDSVTARHPAGLRPPRDNAWARP